MAEDKPFSQVVREQGDLSAALAGQAGWAWHRWAVDLDALVRLMPTWTNPPKVRTGVPPDDVLLPVPMGAGHVDPATLRAQLYRVVADADAVGQALRRAAVLARKQAAASADEVEAWERDWDREEAERAADGRFTGEVPR